jgi:hypothetical protein
MEIVLPGFVTTVPKLPSQEKWCIQRKARLLALAVGLSPSREYRSSTCRAVIELLLWTANARARGVPLHDGNFRPSRGRANGRHPAPHWRCLPTDRSRHSQFGCRRSTHCSIRDLPDRSIGTSSARSAKPRGSIQNPSTGRKPAMPPPIRSTPAGILIQRADGCRSKRTHERMRLGN